MNAPHRHPGNGFTLIEILIVVVIIGILATIVLPRFSDASTDARYVATKAQLSTLRGVIERYRYENTGTKPVMTDWSVIIGANLLRADPVNPSNGLTALAGAAGPAVGWVWRTGSGSAMQLYATGEDPATEFVE